MALTSLYVLYKKTTGDFSLSTHSAGPDHMLMTHPGDHHLYCLALVCCLNTCSPVIDMSAVEKQVFCDLKVSQYSKWAVKICCQSKCDS